MSSQPETTQCNDHRGVAGADCDAAATSNVIAALRRKLRHRDILEHPDVSRELRKLEELLTVQLGDAGRATGRHRMTPATTYGIGAS